MFARSASIGIVSSSKASAGGSGWGPLSSATYDSVSYSVATEETTPHGIFFKPDGTKMYVIGSTNYIYQYSLTTPWDIGGTVTLDGSHNLQTGMSTPLISPATGIYIKSDGTKVYICGSTSTNAQIVEYDLSTAWDVTGGSMTFNDRIQATAFDDNPSGIEFAPDGLTAFLMGSQLDSINSYTLGTAWDITTLNTTSTGTGSVSGQQAGPFDFRFKPDGTKLYVTGVSSDFLYEYVLSTAWDLSTMSYNTGETLDTNPPDGNMSGIFVKSDGTKFWLCGYANDSVYAYTFN